VFFPWIQTRATVPPKHTKGHQELLTTLKTLKSYRPKLIIEYSKDDTEAAAAVATEFTKAWCDFVTDMEDHLAQEEEDIPPLLEKHFTEKEHEATIQQLVQSLGFEGNSRELPWILDGMNHWKGPAETTQWFEDKLPFPVRVLYSTMWKDNFDEVYIQPLKTIQLKQEPVHPSKGCSCN